MIADLTDVMNNFEQTHKTIHDIQERAFPRPRFKIDNLLVQVPVGDWKSIRFPWIHKKEPLAFHSANTLLSKNHAAVSLCRAFRTKF